MKKQEYFLIFNPAADRGRAASLIPKIESLFNSRKINYQLAVTKAPLHATELAKQAVKKGYKIVIAAGGDGTVNEIVNGLAGTDTVMGIIPIGSGNDFSKNLALKKTDLEFNLEVVLRNKVRVVDLGIMNGRYFANQVSMGFTGQISAYTKISPAFLRGYPMYLYSILRMLINYRSYNLHIQFKDENGKAKKIEGDFTLCDVGNSRYEGGGFQVTPDAKIDDEIFDVCIADRVTRKYILRLLPLIMHGQHVNMPHVSMYKVKEITVESDQTIPLHYDGEPNNQYKKVEIKVVPAALKVISYD